VTGRFRCPYNAEAAQQRGLDTLSWARRGAIVTGLDFSRPALDTAVSLAGRAGIGSARFVAAEIGDAGRALAGETFDVVYTGTDVTQWIPDIDSWARTLAALVAPGGFFYIADYHPFPDSFDIAETSANTFIKWNHHIGSVVNALAAAGLRIEFLHEYDFTDAPFHGLERGGDGLWRIPAGRFRIPLMFSLAQPRTRRQWLTARAVLDRLVPQQPPVIFESSGVVGFTGRGLPAAAPV
jgi:SAM-dependent methyltransferase